MSLAFLEKTRQTFIEKVLKLIESYSISIDCRRYRTPVQQTPIMIAELYVTIYNKNNFIKFI